MRYKLIDLITKLQELEERKKTVSDFELKLLLEKCSKIGDMVNIVKERR